MLNSAIGLRRTVIAHLTFLSNCPMIININISQNLYTHFPSKIDNVEYKVFLI